MTRTSQLQIRISPEEKLTLKRLAGLAGQSVSAFVLSRALPTPTRALDATLDGLRTGSVSQAEALGAIRRLAAGLAPAEVAESLDRANVSDLPLVTQNYLAGVAEQLAADAGAPAPGWTGMVPPLERPHFRWPLQSLRPYQLRAGPLTLKRRNIFDATEAHTSAVRPAPPLGAETARLSVLSRHLALLELDVEFYFLGGAVLSQVLPARVPSARPDRCFRVPAGVDPVTEVATREGWPEGWMEETVRHHLGPGRGTIPFVDLPHLQVFTPPPAYALAVKLAARSDEDSRATDNLRFLLRLLNLTRADAAMAAVSHYFSPRQLPPNTDTTLAMLLAP